MSFFWGQVQRRRVGPSDSLTGSCWIFLCYSAALSNRAVSQRAWLPYAKQPFWTFYRPLVKNHTMTVNDNKANCFSPWREGSPSAGTISKKLYQAFDKSQWVLDNPQTISTMGRGRTLPQRLSRGISSWNWCWEGETEMFMSAQTQAFICLWGLLYLVQTRLWLQNKAPLLSRSGDSLLCLLHFILQQ